MSNRARIAPARQPAAAQQQGPKPWVIWMLFGLGWASLLFFGLSVVPFPGGVQWALYFSGWAFVLCWWGGTLMGAGHTEDRRVKPAWTSSLIMACIGTAIGAVPSLAAALYRNWYVIQSVFVAGLIFFALTAYGNTTQGTGEPAAAAAAAGGGAAEGADAGEEADAAAAAEVAAADSTQVEEEAKDKEQ